MKTIKQVEIIPQYVESIPDTKDMKQGILYISEEYQTSSHLCLCGCGCLTVLPFGENFWSLFKDGEKISITPSISNPICKAHYIINKNKANFI